MADDYTKPIAREGEQQYASILRNRSGQDSGSIDYRLRDCTHLPEREQQDMCDTAFDLYQAVCRQMGKKSSKDETGKQFVSRF